MQATLKSPQAHKSASGSARAQASRRSGALAGARGPVVVATLLVLAALLGAAADPPRKAAAKPTSDLWYTLTLGDVHCGWMHHLVEPVDGNIRTRSETTIKLDRAGETVAIEMMTEFVETPEGKPVSMRTRTSTSPTPMETEYSFPRTPGDPQTVSIVTRQGANEQRSTEPVPTRPWLPPAAADRFFVERAAAGAKEIVFDTIDAQSGLKIATTTAKREEATEFKQDRKTIPVTAWRVSTSLLPMETVNHVTAEGEIVWSRTMLGSQRLDSRLATRAEAMRVRRGASPDVLSSTMVQLERPIPDFMRSTRATYRLGVTEGDLAELPSAGAQRFERTDAGRATVRELVLEPLPATDAERADKAYIDPNPMVNFDDERVKALVAEALKGLETGFAAEKAERLRAFVHTFIRRKSLATGFASAGETARSREGDCSEHAVLLCAMLRAAGIPARVAVGLVYADEFAGKRNVFAWHMWTQALIGEQVQAGPNGGDPPVQRAFWVDFDATLPGKTRFHAAHILTGTTSLVDGAMDPSLAAIVPLLGRLKIEVVEVR